MGARGLAVEVTGVQVHSLILGRIGTALPPGQENETKRYEIVACRLHPHYLDLSWRGRIV